MSTDGWEQRLADLGQARETCFELDGARVHGDPNMPAEARAALRTVIAAATQQMLDQQRDEIHRLATILANTRPDDGGTEGEWAIRLHEAGVRPPRVRPRRTP